MHLETSKVGLPLNSSPSIQSSLNASSMLNSTEIINDEQNKKKKKIVSNEKFERKEELKDIYKRRDKLFQVKKILVLKIDARLLKYFIHSRALEFKQISSKLLSNSVKHLFFFL